MNGVEQPLQINLRRGPGPSEGLEVLSRTRPLPSCPTPEANPGHSPSALPPGLSHWRCLWVTRQTRSHLSGLGVIAQPLPTCPQGPVSTPTPRPAPQAAPLTSPSPGKQKEPPGPTCQGRRLQPDLVCSLIGTRASPGALPASASPPCRANSSHNYFTATKDPSQGFTSSTRSRPTAHKPSLTPG